MKLPPPKRKAYLPDKRQAPSKATGNHNLPRWKRYSTQYRKANPFCEVCKASGKITDASPGDKKGVLDHIITTSAGGAMWDARNHMTMCKQCHDRKRRKEKDELILVPTLIGNGGLIPMNRQDIIKVMKK